MKAIVLAAILVIGAACGQAPARSASAVVSPSPAATIAASPGASPSAVASASPTANPSASATPKVSPTLLFAVLEAKGTSNAWTYNTVAIAGLDGYARAKTTFTPMPVPSVGCMGAIVPPSAHVAAGKVYFADGHGVVRSLGIDGKVVIVATFPMTSTQQMLSFAVSPDGTKVLGTIFTLPADFSYCNGAPAGTLNFDAYMAIGGGSSQLVYHDSWAGSRSVLALTGWDSVGPIGTYPTVWASQGGGPGSDLGVYVRIDSTTLRPGAQLADPATCRVWDSTASGAFVCIQPQGTTGSVLSVRRSDGTELWHRSFAAANTEKLAPDAQRVTTCCTQIGNEFAYLVVSPLAADVVLTHGFWAEGWLDSTTIIGELNPAYPLGQPPFNLAYIATSSPASAVSMGFTGQFVGTVRA